MLSGRVGYKPLARCFVRKPPDSDGRRRAVLFASRSALDGPDRVRLNVVDRKRGRTIVEAAANIVAPQFQEVLVVDEKLDDAIPLLLRALLPSRVALLKRLVGVER